MLLVFKRFSEYLTLNIDRTKKILKVTGEQNNYKEQLTSWRMLWDKCEEHKKKPKENNLNCKDCIQVANFQDKETEKMNNEDFKNVFVEQMKVYEFKLVRYEE